MFIRMNEEFTGKEVLVNTNHIKAVHETVIDMEKDEPAQVSIQFIDGTIGRYTNSIVGITHILNQGK